MHFGGLGAVLSGNVVPFVDLPIFHTTEEKPYANRLMLIVQNGSELADTTPITHSSECAVVSRSYDSSHLLNNFGTG